MKPASIDIAQFLEGNTPSGTITRKLTAMSPDPEWVVCISDEVKTGRKIRIYESGAWKDAEASSEYEYPMLKVVIPLVSPLAREEYEEAYEEASIIRDQLLLNINEHETEHASSVDDAIYTGCWVSGDLAGPDETSNQIRLELRLVRKPIIP